MNLPLSVNRGTGKLNRKGDRAARRAANSPVVEATTRLGYAVRGLVYGVIGILALQTAFGGGGKLTDTQGAIAALSRTPLGGTFLYVVLFGLVGYSLWGVIRAGLDVPSSGGGTKEVVQRAGYLMSGVSYAVLAYATYGLIAAKASAARNGAQGAQAQQTTASLLTRSWGPEVIVLVGLAVLAVGLVQVYQGLNAKFTKQFETYALTAHRRTWITRLGRFGTAARGFVFALIGVFLIQAGLRHDPAQAKGIDGVLTALLHQSTGPWLLGLVALGLVAFGCYSALCGFWLRRKS